MRLTESEALKKYCPHGMGHGLNGCLASECMAWRWSLLPNGNRDLVQVAPPTECPDCKGTGTVPDDTGKGKVLCLECDGDKKIWYWEPVGYCGLAGKSEVAG